MGVASLVLGIILGALGRKNVEKKGIATAGLVLCLIFYIACVACIGGLAAL